VLLPVDTFICRSSDIMWSTPS